MADIWKFSSRTVTSLPIQRMEMEELEPAEGDRKRPEMGAWNMAREEGKGRMEEVQTHISRMEDLAINWM